MSHRGYPTDESTPCASAARSNEHRIGALLYLWNVTRRTQPVKGKVPLALVFLSLPVFLNLLFAQVNVWLLIALGEMAF